MQHIETVTVGSGGASSITFSSIPDTYTDLLLVFSARSTGLATGAYFAFNGSTADFSGRFLQGSGSSANSGTDARRAGYVTGTDQTSNTFASNAVYISNYTGSSAKSYSLDHVQENNGTTSYQGIFAGLWNQTAAINSITLTNPTGNMAPYSSASLYGIRKYNTTLAPKASGGIISYDSVNKKWVHVFTASGTFTPTENLSGVEYLVVAGGGGAGTSYGGGGGAGGYRSSVVGESSGGGASAESTLSLTASTGYTVTVGAGGASYTSGSSSTFSTITSVGGGRGGTGNPQSLAAGAESGGSGGGEGGFQPSTNNTNPPPGSGTANQGYAGGNTGAVQTKAGGGGGGAGAVGTDANAGTQIAGNGGAGVASSITGASITRAGGGGGGAGFNGAEGTAGIGGAGGGGNGSNTTAGQNGSPNTGGGGGGGDQDTTTAASGGSGVVIVRYSA